MSYSLQYIYSICKYTLHLNFTSPPSLVFWLLSSELNLGALSFLAASTDNLAVVSAVPSLLVILNNKEKVSHLWKIMISFSIYTYNTTFGSMCIHMYSDGSRHGIAALPNIKHWIGSCVAPRGLATFVLRTIILQTKELDDPQIVTLHVISPAWSGVTPLRVNIAFPFSITITAPSEDLISLPFTSQVTSGVGSPSTAQVNLASVPSLAFASSRLLENCGALSAVGSVMKDVYVCRIFFLKII